MTFARAELRQKFAFLALNVSFLALIVLAVLVPVWGMIEERMATLADGRELLARTQLIAAAEGIDIRLFPSEVKENLAA